MKASHITTPRSLQEAHFDLQGEAFEGFPAETIWRASDLLIALLAVLVLVLIVLGLA